MCNNSDFDLARRKRITNYILHKLYWTWIELIFFRVAHMGLSFGVLTKTILIEHIQAVADKCLHSVRSPSVSYSVSSGMLCNRLGDKTTGQITQQTGGLRRFNHVFLRNGLGISLLMAGGEWLTLRHLVCFLLFFHLIFIYFILL